MSTTKAKKAPTNKFQAKFAAWRLRRRRARQAKKKNSGRKMTILLILVVIMLFGAFFQSLRFLSEKPTGDELTIGQLSALAAQHRIDEAIFLDEDNRLVGRFISQVEAVERAQDEALKAYNEEAKEEGQKDPKADSQSKNADKEDPKAKGQSAKTDEKPKVDPQQKVLDDAAESVIDIPPALLKIPTSPPPIESGRFVVTYPKSGAAFSLLTQLTAASGANVSVDSQTQKAVVRAVSTYLLPLLILASVFGLLFASGKGSSSGIGDVISFGSMGKKKQKKGMSAPTTFADVGSAEEAITELKEVVDYLKNPARYDEIGAVPPKGVLLFGPPGCGKTLLAKAVAGEAGVPFFSVAGAEFVESLVGVGAARVRDLFQRVRAVAPAIVFIDELDAAGRRRGAGGGEGGSDEREQTLNQLLVEMDGFEVSAGIVVMGATNRPDILDPALLRPGRFDRHITVDQPDHEGRKQILELHARGKPIATTVDLDYISTRTPGFSGADLASVINEAALLSLREKKPQIETPELEEAIQRVLHGPKKRGQVLTDEEERRAAYHETGHAIIAAALGRSSDVHRVSILARGRGIGLAGIQTAASETLLTSLQLYSKVVTEMGGLAAEKIALGDVSTGVEQDLEHATDIARDMIGRYGMSPRLGRARLMASDVDQFLGTQTGFAKISATTHEELDEEVRSLLKNAERDAEVVISANRALLDEMAGRLEKEETLEGEELEGLLSRVGRISLTTLHPFATDTPSNGNGTKRTTSKQATQERAARS